MRQTMKFTAVILLALLATACSKPEKHELEGTWQWTRTSGVIAGVNYTPESEGFEAEIVFKGGKFTFYKDGKKVTSGSYRVNTCDYPYPYERPTLGTELFYTLHIPADCEKIAEATNGKINLAPTNFVYLYSVSGDFWELTIQEDHVYDGFQTSFKKK